MFASTKLRYGSVCFGSRCTCSIQHHTCRLVQDAADASQSRPASAPGLALPHAEAPLTEADLDKLVTVFLKETETHVLVEKPMLVVNQVCKASALFNLGF
jgi:hypothetical protein